ncbi:hypothetical protein HKT18_09975, partial [Flavobacterium sp. IMCC34852]
MKRILLLLLILVSTPFFGQTYQTWRSEATDNIWQTNNNWWNFPNGSPIVFGQQEWENNHQLSQQSTADVSTWRFLFKSGASSTHTFTGNKIRFFDFGGQNPSIINNSSANQNINNNIEGDGNVADPLEIRANNGNLTFNGTVNNMGSWVDIYGVNGKSVFFTGAISGSGGLSVKENSTVTISNANNTYSGSTSVDAGTLVVQKGGHSASITSGAIAFTFASTNQAAGVYDFLPGQLAGSTSRTLTSNLVAGKTVTFNYTTGDVTICDNVGVPDFTLPATVCAASSLSSISVSVSNATSYSWSTTSGVVMSPSSGSIAPGSTTFSSTATFASFASGTATLTLTVNGCNGSQMAQRNITVIGLVGTPSFTTGATTLCQDAVDETYTATAANASGITYSVSPVEAGTIDTNTGVMNWSATFSGNATITASAEGCGGPVTANRVVAVTPAVSVPSFTLPATVCAASSLSSISVSVSNATSYSWSTTSGVVMSPSSGSIAPGSTTFSSTATFASFASGTATLTLTVNGCDSSQMAQRNITVIGLVGTPSFTAGATIVCQDASDETYIATASNATEITYSVSPPEAGTIGSSTGVMNWEAGFSGDATITASAAGCGGPLTANRVVTVQSRYLFYVDSDGDGYGSITSSMECSSSALVAPTGFATNDEDCDDTDDTINPGATEVNFNGEDDDCDGSIFNGHAPVVSDVTTPSGALASMTSPIECSVATNTTPYSGASVVHKFRVTRTSPPAAPVEFESVTRTFAISSLSIAAYSATYEVQATAIVNGEEQPYNGNTATFTTPAAPVITTVS